jgi:hypothetical protein
VLKKLHLSFHGRIIDFQMYRSPVAAVWVAISQKGRFLREWRRGGRIAGELRESASQNSFSIPASQKVADPRVSSGAERKTLENPQVLRDDAAAA